MNVEVLVSTMNQKDFSLLDRMRIKSDAVVINQSDVESRAEIDYNGYKVLWINTKERGLSKSRNMAIRNANAEICMLADDDMVYRNDYVNTVLSAFRRIKADIITFQVHGIETIHKNYYDKERKIGYLSSMKTSSVEIAFRRKVFVEKKILFDELVGAGTEYMMGEENAMLFLSLQKRCKIYYVPQVIADLHMGQSTWFTEMNENFFVGKGASFTAMNKTLSSLLIFQWALRKRRLYKGISVFEAIKAMKKGQKMYLKKRRQQNDT